MKLKEEAIDYRDGDAELSGLLVWDGSELAHPGVVVVHGGAGLGALDPHVPTAQLTGFIEEMNAAGTDFQLIVYGGATHGCTHDVGPQAPGVAYHAVSGSVLRWFQ